MNDLTVTCCPLRVQVCLDAALDRDAYCARINLEPGFTAVLGNSLSSPPDVRLANRCGLDLGEPSISTVTLVSPGSQCECDCCRQLSRTAKWSALSQALVKASGRCNEVRLDTDEPLSSLTRRELDVLRLVGQGKTVGQCAESLGVAASTIGNHKYRLMRKLGVTTSLQLLRIAVRNGLAQIHAPHDPSEPDHLGGDPLSR